ncbi:SIR2-like domain protein [Leptospira interrogans serovar Valbuzzi str. Duyster]|uniref:P-loop NTPase n=1 Tax=Leptospira interrogans TaxID=173 RepID=UPI0002B9B414|nr:SIR2 family protein [Leptospira interrogans]EMJ57171.1 SIR2-like domain protein [Leptospira interrogans serovar Valbuzzi str. Duyster]ENO73559.1 SIR2-like domain protein [Leptospira interrogans serovar Valbuzzi str. Valbuzzi]
MIDEKAILRQIEARLESKIILFTGAGFTLKCKDSQGKSLPLGLDLARELWTLIEGVVRTPYDGSGLKETFNIVQKKKPRELEYFLNKRFQIDPNTVPEFYRRYIEFPWDKIYTLNIDDIFEVLNRKYSPRIKVNPVSGTVHKNVTQSYNVMDVYHLNGRLVDGPDNVIFSVDDYATHQGLEHPYYKILASEMNECMFIFIGSELDEEILWKHLKLRDLKERSNNELRPESFIVTPTIKEAKRLMLRERNITHVQMTAEEFSDKILSQLETKYQEVSLRKKQRLLEIKKEVTVPLIQDIIAKRENTSKRRHILLGYKPIWSDILNSKTISRKVEEQLYDKIKEEGQPLLEGQRRKIYLLSGTAGDGKSTTLMRLSLRLSRDGFNVGYLDPDSNFFWNKLKNIVDATDKLDILVIDDIHVYKDNFIKYINEVIDLNKVSCIVVSCRSNKIDRIFKHKNLLNATLVEYSTGKLNDSEIIRLLALLEREDMLGKLTSKSSEERFRILRSKYDNDRQLIVALIEATSGSDLKKYIKDEFTDLDDIKKAIYAIIAIANRFGAKLSSSEISLSLNISNIEFLNALHEMVQRGLLEKSVAGYYSLRHRVIASNVYDKVVEEGNAHTFFESICRMAAIISYDSKLSKNKRIKSLVKICLGHDLLLNVTNKDIDKINEVYDNLKDYYKEQHHYWLQRAVVEIEIGELAYAHNHVATAHSLAPSDPLVLITMYHLDLKKELLETFSDESQGKFMETIQKLRDLIDSRADIDPKPYHILGYQSLNWANRKIPRREEKRDFLGPIRLVVETGVSIFPDDQMLKELYTDIHRTILLTTVS